MYKIFPQVNSRKFDLAITFGLAILCLLLFMAEKAKLDRSVSTWSGYFFLWLAFATAFLARNWLYLVEGVWKNHYRALLRSSEICFAFISATGKIAECSEGFRRSFQIEGWGERRDCLISWIVAEDQSAFVDAIRNCSSNPGPTVVRFIGADGSRMRAQMYATPAFGADGRLSSSLCTFDHFEVDEFSDKARYSNDNKDNLIYHRAKQDMTKLAKLYSSENLYSAIVSAVSEGVLIFDRECKIIQLNAAAMEMLCLDSDQSCETSHAISDWQWVNEDGNRLDPSDWPIRSVLTFCLPIYSFIAGKVDADGRIMWLSVNARPIQNTAHDVAAAVVATFTNVTELKKLKVLEAELDSNIESSERESLLQNRRFDIAVRNSPDGIFLIDKARQFTYVNPAMCSLIGFEVHELAGKSTRLICATDGDWQRIGSDAEKARSSGAKFEGTYNFRRKSGEVFVGRLNGAFVRDADNTICGYVGALRDVSADIKRDRALAESQRLEALGRLTGGIAHDFNNLLTVVLANLQLIRLLCSDDAVDDKLLAAERAVELASNLNKRLMAFAKQRPLEPVVVNLNDTIDDMAPIIKASLGDAHAVELELDLDPDLARVQVDITQFENALLNITLNARDAMPCGGRLEIRTRNVTLDAYSSRNFVGLTEGKFVDITISDTGHGMSPEVLLRSLEPFFTTKKVGTGLGLSIVDSFVKQFEGSLDLSSSAAGTTVKLLLPANPGPQAEKTMVSRLSPRQNGTSAIVLVVEDTDDVRTAIVESLKMLGYLALEATDAKNALDLLAQNAAVDVIFTDVVLPGGLSGVDLANEVARTRSEIGFVITSGNSALAESPLDVRAVRLLKPYTIGALVSAIEEVLH